MALDVIEEHQFKNSIAADLEAATIAFTMHKDKLQQIFNGLQAFIDNVDTPADWVAVLTAKKALGKTLIQNMLDGI